MQEWCPFAKKGPPGHDGGAFTGGGHKIVHHTTDGWKAEHAFAAWQGNNDWAHFVDTYENGSYELYQCLSISVPARSLAVNAGPTNRDNTIQIEHVGWSWAKDKPSTAPQTMLAEHFPDGYLNGMQKLLRWIEDQWQVPRKIPHPFPKFDGDNVRLTWSDWHAAKGHVGHCHAPGNNHTDPGRLNVAHLVGFAQPPHPNFALEKYNAGGIGWEDGLIATALTGALRGEGIACMTIYRARNIGIVAGAAAAAVLRHGPRLVAIGQAAGQAVTAAGHVLGTEEHSDLFGAIGKGETPEDRLGETVRLTRSLVKQICAVEHKDPKRGSQRFAAVLSGLSDSFDAYL